MLIESCTQCKKPFTADMAPCPDGRIGCLVAHYSKESFICPCGFDMGPAIADVMQNGLHFAEVGVGIVNTAAVAKMNFDITPGDVYVISEPKFLGKKYDLNITKHYIDKRVDHMEKYGVETDDTKTKTAEEGRKVCPRCGEELEKPNGTYINKCPTHGTEPFEVRK